MSILRLSDGRVYEIREVAEEMFMFLSSGNTDPGAFVYIIVRQPGTPRARYKGITLQQGLIASIEDDGLGHARTALE